MQKFFQELSSLSESNFRAKKIRVRTKNFWLKKSGQKFRWVVLSFPGLSLYTAPLCERKVASHGFWHKIGTLC